MAFYCIDVLFIRDDPYNGTDWIILTYSQIASAIWKWYGNWLLSVLNILKFACMLREINETDGSVI